MVTFYCDGCGALVFFESVTCVSCGRALGFLPDVMSMTALEPAGDVWKSLADGSPGKLYRACANGRDYGARNSINRGLGLPDLYPYVLSPKAIEKLRLVHEVITAARGVPAVVRV
jgi:hypothetical protein